MQSFRHVVQLQGKKDYGIFVDSSPIRQKFWSVKFWFIFLACARKFFMENIVSQKVYMIPFLPRVVINFPHDTQG